MKTRARSMGVALACLVTCALLVAPAEASARRCGGIETVPIFSLDVQVETDKKVYSVGETVKLDVTVMRPAHHDPAGQGVEINPPQQYPAEGVNVGIGLRIGDVFLYGYGTPTDADGHSSIGIKLRPYTPAGSASVDAFGWKRTAEIPCFIVEEQGYIHVDGAFTVKK